VLVVVRRRWSICESDVVDVVLPNLDVDLGPVLDVATGLCFPFSLGIQGMAVVCMFERFYVPNWLYL
jgi:hypothetical protein